MRLIWISGSIFLMSILVACRPKPKEIDYGLDACYFCKMMIVDNIHAAELVTSKGKVYKFDSIECMLMQLQKTKLDIALYLVNYYEAPRQLTNATTATYLVSEQFQSPMGASLTAFKSKEDALKIQQEKGGRLYTWKTIRGWDTIRGKTE